MDELLRCSIRHPDIELLRAFPILLSLMCLLWITQANAQTLYGSIVGTVRDGSGAVIPDASVKATQLETNEKRTKITTNNDGLYTLSTLPAGTYIISISKSGFDLYEAKNVELAINTTIRVDAKLPIGQPTDSD